MPAPSSRTSFPLTDGSIPKTSGCSCCVRTPALLSSIISSTLCAVECLFQNSVICSRVWGLASTRSVTKIEETLNYYMTWTAPRTISLENHMKRKSHMKIWVKWSRSGKMCAALLEKRIDRCRFAPSEQFKLKPNCHMIKCLRLVFSSNGVGVRVVPANWPILDRHVGQCVSPLSAAISVDTNTLPTRRPTHRLIVPTNTWPRGAQITQDL